MSVLECELRYRHQISNITIDYALSSYTNSKVIEPGIY
jgi:hypothetical protein